eukprot:3780553-Rhodomonas_salina.1
MPLMKSGGAGRPATTCAAWPPRPRRPVHPASPRGSCTWPGSRAPQRAALSSRAASGGPHGRAALFVERRSSLEILRVYLAAGRLGQRALGHQHHLLKAQPMLCLHRRAHLCHQRVHCHSRCLRPPQLAHQHHLLPLALERHGAPRPDRLELALCRSLKVAWGVVSTVEDDEILQS